METTRILIIDSDKEFLHTINDYFQNNPNINVIGTATNGEEGLQMIRKQDNYDVVLLDLLLSKIDGLSLLKEIKNRKKKSFIMTYWNSPEAIEKALREGVSYYLLKPVSLASVENLLLDMMNSTVTREDSRVIRILHELGIPSHLKGYQYLKEGVTLFLEEDIHQIKECYERIAEECNTSTSQIERSMRHAIELGWTRGDWDTMESIFGNSIDLEKGKPTNGEFLKTVAERLTRED